MARWGIMATGNIAGVFAGAISATDGADLAAVASRDKSKAEKFAEKFGIKKAYSSYEALACDADIDVIYIATPMSCHYENIKQCLENGKHVLCEKTIVLNSNQLLELIKLAKEKNLFLMEAMWTKFLPAENKAVEWIKQGLIGKIKYIKADFCINAGYNPESRLFCREKGGGAMLDLGVYALSFVCDFLGNSPKKVMTAANVGETGVDFDFTVLLDYGESSASIAAGFSSSADNNAVIIGENGRICFDSCFMNTRTISLYDKFGACLQKFEGKYGGLGYEFEVEEVERCIREKRTESPRNPLSDTLAVMKIMDACRNEWGVKYPCEETDI